MATKSSAELDQMFETRLSLMRGQETGDSFAFVHDMLEVAWVATQHIFKEQATPELALEVYDRFVIRLGNKKTV
jgi:hypothetical protein